MAQRIVILSTSGKSSLPHGDSAAEQYLATPLPSMLADGWLIQSITAFGGISTEPTASVAVLLEKQLSSSAKTRRGVADREGATR